MTGVQTCALPILYMRYHSHYLCPHTHCIDNITCILCMTSHSPYMWHRFHYATISSSVIPFFSCLQSFPASRSFQMSQFFTSGDQSTGTSVSAKVLPAKMQEDLTGLISLPSNGFSSSPTPQFKTINSLSLSLLYGPTLTSIHDYWNNHSFDYMDLCWQSNVSSF